MGGRILRVLGVVAVAASCLVAAATSASSASDVAPLRARVEKALQHRGLQQAIVSVLVVRAEDGSVLFEREPDRLLVPASNAKILTALGALMVFGPTHRFTTRVYSDSPPDANGAVQNLAVLGGGDASMTSEQWWRLADDLRFAGLTHVHGDLLLDDTRFDSVRWHASWGDASSRAYHAPVGALTANYGAFAVQVRPGPRSGSAALVSVDPQVATLRVKNSASTGSAGSSSSIAVNPRAVDGTVEEVVVSGSIALGAKPQLFQRSVHDPLLYAGAVLRAQLAAQGISVGGSVRPFNLSPSYTEILAFEGKAVAEIVQLCMKYSNNNLAESLIKAMGAQAGGAGTWEAGTEALRRHLAAVGIDVNGFHLVDGSGLSANDRASPRTLVAALRVVRRSFLFGPEFLSALPIAARDGTLAHRAGGAKDLVRAKTGLLNNAVALSGFAAPEGGEEMVFSILVNDFRRGGADAMAGVDAFVAALVAAPPG